MSAMYMGEVAEGIPAWNFIRIRCSAPVFLLSQKRNPNLAVRIFIPLPGLSLSIYLSSYGKTLAKKTWRCKAFFKVAARSVQEV